MTTPLIASPLIAPSSAALPDSIDLGPADPTRAWWEQAEVLLVADRSQGSTHRFFRNWRVEVLAGPDEAEPGRCLFTAPISPQELAASSWQNNLVRLDDRPEFGSAGTATFSWSARTTDTSPNPFALAHGRAQSWLMGKAR